MLRRENIISLRWSLLTNYKPKKALLIDILKFNYIYWLCAFPLVWTCTSQKTVFKSSLFLPFGSKGGTLVIKLSRERLYQVNHLTGPLLTAIKSTANLVRSKHWIYMEVLFIHNSKIAKPKGKMNYSMQNDEAESMRS